MSNPSKVKGSAGENAVADYLKVNGFLYAERRVCAGANDKGDIAGVPGWVIEVKKCNTVAVPAWLREAEAEATNANVHLWCVWHWVRGKTSPADWVVTMPAHVFAAVAAHRTHLDPLPGVKPVTMTGAAFVELLAYDEIEA